MYLEIKSIEASRSIWAKILGFLLGYFAGFIQIPFYCSVFFLAVYITTTLFHSYYLQDHLIAIFFWPLQLFHYPDTATYTSFKPIATIIAFWLMIFHIFWLIVGKIFREQWVFQKNNSDKVTNLAFIGSLTLALISTIYADNVDDKPTMSLIIVVIAFSGWFSYWLSKAIFRISITIGSPDPSNTK